MRGEGREEGESSRGVKNKKQATSKITRSRVRSDSSFVRNRLKYADGIQVCRCKFEDFHFLFASCYLMVFKIFNYIFSWQIFFFILLTFIFSCIYRKNSSY